MLSKLKDLVDKHGLLVVSKLMGERPEKLIEQLDLPYKSFKDIQFNKHSIHNGVSSLTQFKNGYGVSVIRTEHSYGGEQGLYEMAIMKDGHIVYDTPITSDVLAYLTPEQVTEYMIKTQDL